jgi:hypothetical protein
MEPRDVHTRYCLRIGDEVLGKKNYIGHSGGCLGTPVVKFEGARIWVRRADAVRYMRHQNVRRHRGLVVVPVACAVGEAYAVLTK